METTIFFKGLLLGFVIAAPTGPIGILCARRVLTHGRRAAFASGMGAATADVIFGFIAAFGLTFIAYLLSEYHFGLRLAGGMLLCVIGMRTFFARPENCHSVNRTGKLFAGLYTSTFFLTLTNPATILSFGAVFAAFGLAGARGSVLSAGTLVLGVFLGSALWWLFLIGIFSLLKNRIGQQQVLWVNYIGGIVVAGSGLLALLTLAF
jgi:threonine/homoserine/homoserine lactone efflux protein